MSRWNMRQRVAALSAACAIGALGLLVSCASDSSSIVAVEAPKITGISYVDEGDTGAGPGDRRVFVSNGTDGEGRPVRSDWELTTIVNTGETEVRIARAVFNFADGSQLVLEGSAEYPMGGGTLDRDVVVDRPIVGGSGRFAAARGFVRTTHRANDTWRWEFHLYS